MPVLNFMVSLKHLAVDEVIVLYNGRFISKHYIPKKHKYCGMKIYKLYNVLEYTYDVRIYLGKDRQSAT
jgi:hypothetical protein